MTEQLEPRAWRIAFRMRLNPGGEEPYKKAHDELWPEMRELIALGGVRNYSIFREGLDLFAVMEVDENSAPVGGENPVVRRWWASLERYMESEPDGSPRMSPMEEVFHVD
ncbi:MAG: L-rhamnose mutarotase [Microbacteriaceae bacterium]|nr:L-rhamnose mutarotase [Microbacteriaceae bacterium]